jgi:2-methylaconitate cis-trans-isomerase PrpF
LSAKRLAAIVPAGARRATLREPGFCAYTSKVAIVSPSRVPGADVDYLFAQVRVEQRLVDTSPNCGNMIAGVGPFAIEAGMVSAQDGETRVRIFNVSTGYSIMQATWCRHVSREGRLKTPPEAT